ncbi:MAG: helix-turn-helix domain-containing protein [bacterium]|nr:helix-turn-helix domain-containing protein [bacterium]
MTTNNAFNKKYKRPFSLEEDPGRNEQVRASVKPTRLYLDNEYFKNDYASIFPHSVTIVYCILAMFANHKTQTCFPSAQTMMELGGITNRNTLFRALQILERYDIISVIHRSKGRLPNKYSLLEHYGWREVNSINFDTVIKELSKKKTVSKTPPQQSQNIPANGSTGDTGIHLMDSDKEINLKIEEKKIPLKGKQLLERLSTATTSVVIPYFREDDIIKVLEEIYESGETETPNFKTILRALRQREAIPTAELPAWLKL